MKHRQTAKTAIVLGVCCVLITSSGYGNNTNQSDNVVNLSINQNSKELLAPFSNQHAILPYSARPYKDGQICRTHIGILGASLVNQGGKTC